MQVLAIGLYIVNFTTQLQESNNFRKKKSTVVQSLLAGRDDIYFKTFCYTTKISKSILDKLLSQSAPFKQ